MARPLVGFHDGCALHGALATAAAIEGVTPLVHSTPGCALRGAFATTASSGFRGAPIHLSPISSTNLAEKHIVFGGASRLREQIKNTLSVLPRGLLVVITGCPTEMIGDDVPAMVREAVTQGEAVVEVGAAGFLGSAHRGYERVLAVLAERLPDLRLPSEPPAQNLVNIFGVVPRYDESWASDLDEIGRLLGGVGLTANPIFGPGGGLSSLAALPNAVASLVLSPWGLAPAEALRRQAGVPVVVADGLPVGADAVEKLVRQLAEATGAVEEPAIARLLNSERRYEDFALDETLDALTRLGRRRVALVGPSLLGGSLARFLVSTLGFEASALVLTDEPDGAEELAPEGAGRVVATADGVEAAEAIRASGADFLIAGARYGALAAELGIPHAVIGDLGGRASLSGGFVGARGAGRLLAALTSAPAASKAAAPRLAVAAQ
jgi:nitrogenase molybdenum-iron protein beta chain